MTETDSLPVNAIEVHGLEKTYAGTRKAPPKTALRGVDLVIPRGSMFGLLGPNGAGKTTCFYMITGLIPADSGSIWLDGENITAQPMYQRARMGLGYLAQEASIFRGMTVEQNVKAVVELRETGKGIDVETTRLLEELHIDHLRHAPAQGLSGGERRRLEITRALVVEPKLLFFDEPFAGVDPKSRNDITAITRELKRRGISVLITDHHAEAILGMVDRLYVMDTGNILAHGTPAEIVANTEVRRAYLGDHFKL